MYEILWLVLSNNMPCNSSIQTVLQQDGFVCNVGVRQVNIAACCLRYATDLQHKHDFAEDKRKHFLFSNYVIITMNELEVQKSNQIQSS